MLFKLSLRLHDKEWSKDFLRSTNHKEEINQGYPTISTFENGKLKQPMLENQWASDYLQNVPLIGGNYDLTQQIHGQIDYQKFIFVVKLLDKLHLLSELKF